VRAYVRRRLEKSSDPVVGRGVGRPYLAQTGGHDAGCMRAFLSRTRASAGERVPYLQATFWSERAILTPQRRASHPVSRRLRCQERGLSFGRLSLKLSTEATGGVYPMAETQVSIRIDLDTGGRIGPGKIALLEAISKTGSITAAARSIICPIVERGSGRDK
jgi:hypothetical protein